MLLLEGEEKEGWLKAMQSEFDSLRENKVFTQTKLPAQRNVIGCRWLYKVKYLPGGEILRKARLVAKGYSQREGQDFDGVFAPTVKSDTLKATLCKASRDQMQVHHFDFTTAYLNADLNEELYMEQIPGFESANKQSVLKLHKAIYGLKQSARSWSMCLSKALVSLGFKQGVADPCMFTRCVGGKQCILLVYVDNICLLIHDQSQLNWFKNAAGSLFNMKHLGSIQNYLGVEITRNPEGYFELSQGKKIEQLLTKFEMAEAKCAVTPMTTGYIKEKSDQVFENKLLFQSLVGSLLYLSCWTRPDICIAVHLLSQRCACPYDKDWVAAKRVLQYLKGMVSAKRSLNTNEEEPVMAYSDASWGTEKM